MRTTTVILPGIKRIGWVDCLQLPRRVDLHGICRMPFAILTDIHQVDFFDEPSCSCLTETACGRLSDSASLKFHCGVLLPIHRRLGFVVEDQRGKLYLIGSKEPPYPEIQCSTVCGVCDGDGAGYVYEITHKALKTLVECIASF